MEYRNMGKTGLQLSLLSFGSWISFGKQLNATHADRLMGIAYEEGINFFDNAESYAGGESEKIMGQALRQKKWERSSYAVSSKVFFGWREKNKPNQTGLSRKHVTEACEEALQRLGADYLDLFFCHRPDKQTPVEETVWTMHNLIQQGKILYWGTSEWSGAEIMEAHRAAKENSLIGPSVEQPQYNLFTRAKVEQEFLEIYKNAGLGLTIWSPLAGGLLTGKYNQGLPKESRFALEGMEWLKERWMREEHLQKVKALSETAKSLGVSMASLAIAWCIKNPNVSTAILGASREEQLRDNLSAIDTLKKLSPEVIEEIEAIMKNKPTAY